MRSNWQSERLARHGKQITAELIRKLFLFGTAEEVLSALRPYVDHGVNHFIIYSYAYALKPSVAAGYLLEQASSDAAAQKARAGCFQGELATTGQSQNVIDTSRRHVTPTRCHRRVVS